ncbi:alpha/beta hydrolase [Leucobacter chromiireducens]|uniref:alpha/beta hydrolase n=1 Tax=Leucobacter chromiireducens TaxID=283877 RepID=UPI003F8108FC
MSARTRSRKRAPHAPGDRRLRGRTLLTAASAGLVAALALLTACAPVERTASALQSETFPGAYAQTIEWGECGDDFGLDAETAKRVGDLGAPVDTFECATVEAPLDWNTPRNHDTIELAVVRVPATGPTKLGALFGNPGGPGGSGIDYTWNQTASPGFQELLAHYDVIGFDPRGTGRSDAVDCEPVSSIFEVQLAVCADDFPLARTMGTSQVARDMDLLRALQGEDRMNYLGYSYGTILGATYSTLFPERVGRMVLDSAPDETWAAPAGTFDQAVAMATELVAMVEDCEETPGVTACPITSEDELLAAQAALTEQPIVASDGTEVTGDTLSGYLMTGLYGRALTRVTVLNHVAGLLERDPAQVDAVVAAMSDGGAAVSSSGLIVRCHSLPDDPGIVELLNHIEDQGVPRLLGGPEITDDVLRPFADVSCDALPESGTDLEAFSAPDDQTMLVIGIEGDHATPFANGKNLAMQMGNTRFLTVEGHGHGASFTDRSSCADQATTAFLLEGELPAKGTVCPAN